MAHVTAIPGNIVSVRHVKCTSVLLREYRHSGLPKQCGRRQVTSDSSKLRADTAFDELFHSAPQNPSSERTLFVVAQSPNLAEVVGDCAEGVTGHYRESAFASKHSLMPLGRTRAVVFVLQVET